MRFVSDIETGSRRFHVDVSTDIPPLLKHSLTCCWYQFRVMWLRLTSSLRLSNRGKRPGRRCPSRGILSPFKQPHAF